MRYHSQLPGSPITSAIVVDFEHGYACIALVSNRPSINMFKPTLYYIPGSPPARSVVLVARALGVELEMKYVRSH